MSAIEVPSNDAILGRVDMKLEIVVIPVSNIDRAKQFYAKLGWRLDADYDNGDDFRVIQFTPPGSGCSVIFGKNVTAAAPGSAQGLYLIVSDIQAARNELVAHGVDATEVFHDANGVYAGPDQPYLFGRLRASGLDPEHRSYRSFLSFSDPDGNGWLLQEIKERLPGRGVTIDVAALAQLLHETAEHHGSFETVAPPHDWWDWYAAYMDARERGRTPEEAAAAAGRYMAEVKHVVVSPA
ncbi:MAG: glyoxalase [Terriglobia bacterium]|nr:MAG: glyoxalase [Terriglobia bacterium]